ncbi:hypothetical protein I4U23_019164 [Adineta vaga]|nr:hypothetical protein I4U23_019164 [Adineta vaga]
MFRNVTGAQEAVVHRQSIDSLSDTNNKQVRLIKDIQSDDVVQTYSTLKTKWCNQREQLIENLKHLEEQKAFSQDIQHTKNLIECLNELIDNGEVNKKCHTLFSDTNQIIQLLPETYPLPRKSLDIKTIRLSRRSVTTLPNDTYHQLGKIPSEVIVTEEILGEESSCTVSDVIDPRVSLKQQQHEKSEHDETSTSNRSTENMTAGIQFYVVAEHFREQTDTKKSGDLLFSIMSHESMSYRPMITTDDEANDQKLPMTGRLTPIGGASSDTEYGKSADEELHERSLLLEEHEKLTTSLAALTRHFAHVQLRLHQVVSAPTPEDRENLLVELHEFASNGIPDVMCQSSMNGHEQVIEAEKCREKDFINELKQKLDELEHYAAASGSLEGAPTSVTMEKQRILIDQLRQKLDLQLDDASVSKLSAEELRKLIDQAIYQLTNPVKLKENLINQMRTQIGDLEKFIEFLKTDSVNTTAAANNGLPPSPQSSSIVKSKSNSMTPFQSSKVSQSTNPLSSHSTSEHNSSSITHFMKRFLVLTQLYTFLLLTCGTRSMHKTKTQLKPNRKKDPIARKHFGDIRAKLEVAIENVLSAVRSNQLSPNDTDDNEEVDECDSTAVILSVRQELASAIRALLEHGLYETNYSTSLSIFGCFSSKSGSNYLTMYDTMHAWKLFLKYYELKHGDEFINSPARKLSQSFSLDVIGGKPITIRQCLLSGIDMIQKLHEKHAKPMDSCFKSFICYALNEKKLVPFLRIILKSGQIVENYYQPWSYTKQTGFSDALHSLDRLNEIDFHLPIDLSVRRFMSSRDLIE